MADTDEPMVLELTRAEAGLVQALTRQALRKHEKNLRALEAKFGVGSGYQSDRVKALQSLHDKAKKGLGR